MDCLFQVLAYPPSIKPLKFNPSFTYSCVNLHRTLSSLMVFSGLFLAIGGLILRMEDLVPPILTFSTIAAIVFILAIAHFINLEKKWAIHLGLLLGIFSILFNFSQPSHINAVFHPVMSAPFLLLVASEILGFFVLPAAYIIIYTINFRKITGKS